MGVCMAQRGPIRRPLRRGADGGRARARRRAAREFDERRRELLGGARARQARARRGGTLDFPEDRARARATGRSRPLPRPARPPGRDHRADRAQDGHQRAELGRARLHGRLRGRQLAHVDEHGRRPGQPDGRRPGHDRARRARRPRVPPQRRHRHPARAPARLASARAPPRGGRRSRGRRARGRRSVRLPQRARAPGARRGTVPLPAQARERAPRRRCGTTSSSSSRRRSAWTAGTIRATVLIETLPAAFQMDEILHALRAARDGAERRALGLHLLDHQALPHAPRVRAPGPLGRDHDRSLHAGLHRVAGGDVPPARRARDGRDGGGHTLAARRGGERTRLRRGPGGQGTRGGRRVRRHVGGPSRLGRRSPMEASTPCWASGPTSSSAAATTSRSRAADLLAVDKTPGDDHRGRAALDVNVGIQYISSWLRGNGAAAIYGLMEDAATAEISAGPGVAVGPPRRDARRRPRRHAGARARDRDDRSSSASAPRSPTTSGSRRRAARASRASCSTRSRSARSSPSSSPCRRTSGWRASCRSRWARPGPGRPCSRRGCRPSGP